MIYLKVKGLQEIFENKSFGKILFNEPMRNHTTFKIGGPADVNDYSI